MIFGGGDAKRAFSPGMQSGRGMHKRRSSHKRVGRRDMTYEEIVDTIENKRRFGNLAGVEITRRMLEKLGNPQEGMKVIHIAGTNGKGSVSAFLCEILKEAGLKAGMFTSPHLVDFRERIRINGSMIARADVSRLGESLLQQDFGVYPTMFDYCLVMAIEYFKEQQCDVVILETGLGGRLDSTNAIGVPEVSVITKIGYDHMAILGNTLEGIAAEKAGIIKEGTSLVIESQEPGVLSIFDEAAKRANVRQYQVIDPAQIRDCHYEDGVQTFSFGGFEKLKMRLLGVHQYENAAAAILAATAFLKSGAVGKLAGEQIEKSVRQGLFKTGWQGRMEILRKEPFLMVDGAHNSNGVAALRDSLAALFPGEKFHFIMGVMADKDYENMIEELLPFAIDFKTVTVESSRAMQAEALADCIQKSGVKAETCGNLRDCLFAENADNTGKTVAFGSLYFIGEIEELFLQRGD